MNHHDHTSIPSGSPQGLSRPVYHPKTWRDYVPPPIFTRVRTPVPLPRADLKDQDAHRRGAIVPAVPAPQPATAAPGTRERRFRVPASDEGSDGKPAAAYIRAVIAALPDGVGLTLRGIRSAIPSYINEATARHAAARMVKAGEVQARYLIAVADGYQCGRVVEYRRAQPGPWGDPPDGTCLPGHRPRMRPLSGGLAADIAASPPTETSPGEQHD